MGDIRVDLARLREKLSGLEKVSLSRLEQHIGESDKRFENIYHAQDRFRDMLNTMVTADEYDRRHSEVEKRVGRLELAQSRGTGIVAGVSITLGLLIGGFVALALHLFG